MKILVTGANGHIGQGLVTALIELGNYVVAVDKEIDFIDGRAEAIKQDIFLVEDPYSFFGHPDVVLHAAWTKGCQHHENEHINMLQNHYRFLEACYKSKIKKIAVMGSVHEIGDYEGCVDEDTPCNPRTPYGVSKNALRQLALYLAEKHQKPLLWLRRYYVIGNNNFGETVFSKITAAVKKGQKEFPFVTGEREYDFLEYDKFCKMIAKCVCQDEVAGIINICSGYPEKLKNRVERFIKEQGYEILLQYGRFPEGNYKSNAIWGNDKKIKKVMEI